MASVQMKIIKDRLAEKEEQLRIIQAEISLLRSMMAEGNGEPDPSQKQQQTRRANVKVLVLKLLESAGIAGLNAVIAVDMARTSGHHLERNSVSSILSRLKADGAVFYDGERYKLTKFESASATSNVHLHPASKGVHG